MDNLKKLFTQNKAFSLTVINILLFVVLFISRDPFGLFTKSYETSEVFIKADPKTISRITIEKPKVGNLKYELQKQGEQWKVILKDQIFPAEEEKINQLIKSLLSAKKFTVVTSSKDKESEYGFGGEDEVKLEIFSDSSSLGSFYLGSAKESGGGSHVKWKEEGNIYLVEDNLKANSGRGAEDYFLEKKLSPKDINSEELLSINLNFQEKNKTGFEIKKSDKEWNLIKPKTGVIPAEEMGVLTGRITSFYAENAVLDNSVLTALDKSNNFELEVQYKEKSGQEKRFKLSSLGQEKNTKNWYIRKDGERPVYKFSESSFKSILEFTPEAKIKK